MDCSNYIDLISARLDGQLTAQEEVALTAHLQECPACRAIANDLQTLRSSFTQTGEVDAPPALSQGVMQKIKAERLAARRRFVHRLSGLAACLLLCVGLYQLNRTERPATADPNLPSVARHTDPQPFDSHQTDSHHFSNEQRVRLSGMITSFVPTADLLGNPEDISRFITRFPYDDLSELMQTYDEEYFRTNRLLAVVVQEPSSSIFHTISGLTEDTVTVLRHVPQSGDSDMALWLILAQVDGTGPETPLNVELRTN